MNIFINNFNESIYFPLVYRLLEHFEIKKCILTYRDEKMTIPPGTDATFYNAIDLVSGRYDADFNDLLPLDEKIINDMEDCEVVVLKMLDRSVFGLTYSDRKRIYLKHLRYWNHVLENTKIDLFISGFIPHDTYDYIVYKLCKLKDIRTIFLSQICISDSIAVMEELPDGYARIKESYQNSLNKYKDTPESEIPLSARFQRDLKFNTKKDPARFEMQRKKPRHNYIRNLVGKLYKIKTDHISLLARNPLAFIKKITYHYTIVRTDKELHDFYNKNSANPDLSNKFIYFPLHMQPECSTSPMAGAYVEQILIAQMIAHNLPEDIYIYVKENPYQTLAGRDMDFYKELLRIPQVRFVPTTFNTFDLTNASIAVATATGTAGWEALYRGKPVLMFGYNFYQYARGVFRIKTNQDCKEALESILIGNIEPSLKDVIIYSKALEETTIEGYADIDYQKDTQLTIPANNENILKALINHIENSLMGERSIMQEKN